MSALAIEFHEGAVFLPALNLWLDAHEPRTGPELVFVSHAHSDHLAGHREVILSAPTARLMQARIGRAQIEHVLPFGENRRFAPGAMPFECRLLPAGHIFGSAMSLLEVEGESLLYTGDFKLRRGLSAEPCEPRPADVLIMETTYGRPEYQFPPTADVMRGIVRFCREALDNDETALLLGYSLGKSQELLCALGEAGLPFVLHGAVHQLTQIYEQFGQCFPKYERYDPATARGKVLLCPPSVVNSAMVKNLGKTRSAILTGWAVDPNCRYRYQADAAFPLSDHADFLDLIEMVKRVAPKKVYTLHGFAADFAQTLRKLGYQAQALSEVEQMTFDLEGQSAVRKARRLPEEPARVSKSAVAGRELPARDVSFLRFAETCAAIALTSSKLEKVRLLGEYLRGLEQDALYRAAIWFTGTPFPPGANKVLQLGWAVIREALCAAGNIDAADLHGIYLKHSDVGESAFELWQRQGMIPPTLTIDDVGSYFDQLHAARGPSGKVPVLIRVLRECSPLEAKFLIKIITSDLRIGLKEGLVEEAIAHACGAPPDEVRQANLLLGNIGETALLAQKNELGSATITPFRPIKFMLASPEPTAGDIWERAQNRVGNPSEPAAPAPVLWLEDKYDGIRCQLHKAGQRVALYSRDLKEISGTFHDLSEAARALGVDVILDGEIVAMRGDAILPFAELQRRLGRRERDLFLRDEMPVKYVAFDLLWQNGQSQLRQPLRERRRLLETLPPLPEAFRLARITQADSVEQIESAFLAARGRRNEGLMIKDPESLYSPGRRGLAWLKLKKALATLDCIVVGAEYGHGKRNKVLSDYTFAVRDDETGELKTIGKAYSGLTDAEIAQLTDHFLKTATAQRGRYFTVRPEIVLEIAFDRLQPSPRHQSGLAMRFPRIVRIRTDKTLADIDTLRTAQKLAGVRSAGL